MTVQQLQKANQLKQEIDHLARLKDATTFHVSNGLEGGKMPGMGASIQVPARDCEPLREWITARISKLEKDFEKL